jgi:cell division septation protein DedD
MSPRQESTDQPDSKPRRPARRRNRLASEGRGARLSRPLAAAFILILAGAAYLFWPRGGGSPVGLGERLSVVTADSVVSSEPRSGAVDIDQEVQPLVAEKPAEGATRAASVVKPEQEPAAPVDTVTTTPAAKPKPRPTPEPQPRPRPQPTTPPPPAAPAAERLVPGPTGGWAVQVGAYGNEQNAEKVASDLQAAGIGAHVRAANTSDGELVYRVWIGWFTSRDQALSFARQERSRLGDAHPVHR